MLKYAPVVGETIGSYRVLAEIGAGGMGTVYLAEHRHLARRAAVKVLRPELCQQRDLLQRFFTEARATSAIEHPGIVHIVDCDVDAAGRPFMVMELIEGETLNVYLHRCGALSCDHAAGLARGVAEALAAAHDRGIIHRDVKPENVFVLPGTPPTTKIVDFGIAKLAGALAISTTRTQTGTMMGTPLYMSPEQCRGAGAVDWRTDVYSLGCTLFEMLCGRPPFRHEGFGELVAAHMLETPPLPSTLAPGVPAAMDALVARLLQKAPSDRPQSMHEVAAALAALTAPPRADTPPPPPALARTVLPDARPSRPVETTLRGSATEVTDALEPARAGRAPFIVGAAVVVAVAVSAALWPRGQHPTGLPPPVSPAPAAPSTAASAVLPAAVATAPKPPERKAAERPRAVAAAHQPPARPGKVHLGIDSDPTGAEVCLASDHVLLGNARVSVELPGDGGRVAFLVRHPGYRIERVSLRADRDQTQLVKLHPLGPDDLEAAAPCHKVK
jgi:serine/threonine-protein kinase